MSTIIRKELEYAGYKNSKGKKIYRIALTIKTFFGSTKRKYVTHDTTLGNDIPNLYTKKEGKKELKSIC